MRAELHHYFGAPIDKIEVIINGIALKANAGCTKEEQQRLRAQLAAKGEPLLFFVGRVTHEKGLHILIRAMPRILADYPNTRLLVAGKNGNQMWPLAYELNIERAVDFLGYVSDQQRDCLYQVVDAAVFPSLYEPFGIVALEAMALGCNVIASDVGGLGAVVKHQQNGLTVLPDNPQSIVWAVNQLLSDPGAARIRREQALAEVNTIYRWENVALQTARLYQAVVHERSHTEW
jgi:glycosyltransferase involved in cell wall biosynthesis